MHVAANVELVVVDPNRVVQPERHVRQLLPVTRRAPEPLLELPADAGQRRAVVTLGNRDQPDPADVHVGAGTLDLQERGIERRQPWT